MPRRRASKPAPEDPHAVELVGDLEEWRRAKGANFGEVVLSDGATIGGEVGSKQHFTDWKQIGNLVSKFKGGKRV